MKQINKEEYHNAQETSDELYDDLLDCKCEKYREAFAEIIYQTQFEDNSGVFKEIAKKALR